MKLIPYLCLVLCLFWGSGVTAQTQPAKTEFFLSLEDIPLMDGLEELPTETLSFDKPEGRIIESYAAMNSATESQVSTYYAQTLPAFGWGKTSKNKFFRKEEFLEISFESDNKNKFVKITIRPSL